MLMRGVMHGDGGGGGGGGGKGGGGVGEKYRLLRTSLRYNFQTYFDNSSLHGVRFIREEKRPFREKFLWFFCIIVGTVATLIIIVSLWEKFQTNPTITGLDTDFHNWDVPFPGVWLCSSSFVDDNAVDELAQTQYSGDQVVKEFLKAVAGMSLYNLEDFSSFFEKGGKVPDVPLADIATQLRMECGKIVKECLFKGPELPCCENFKSLMTEVGPCLAFNAKHAWPKGEFILEEILETDETLSLSLLFHGLTKNHSAEEQYIKVYLLSNDEVPSVDAQPQAMYDYRISHLFFSEKHTYTTPDTRQLSLRQRRCAFADEIKLQVDAKYTFNFCMIQCRMQLARSLCGCVAPLYPPTQGFRVCEAKELQCLADIAKKLRTTLDCTCDLGCDHTIYEIERLQEVQQVTNQVEVTFVSWPLIRYKREVLFGWVDLLVSFGGIAGLFLGFSLLSGVEIVYYFTMRACCMARKDKEELQRLQREYDTAPRPALDLSLSPYFGQPPGGGGGPGLKRVRPAAEPAAGVFAPAAPAYLAPQQPHAVLRAPRAMGGYEYMP